MRKISRNCESHLAHVWSRDPPCLLSFELVLFVVRPRRVFASTKSLSIGTDMGLGILDYVAKDLYNEPKAPNFYRDKVASGELGAKSGKGFYDWSKKSIEEVKARRDRFVIDVLRARKIKRESATG